MILNIVRPKITLIYSTSTPGSQISIHFTVHLAISKTFATFRYLIGVGGWVGGWLSGWVARWVGGRVSVWLVEWVRYECVAGYQ